MKMACNVFRQYICLIITLCGLTSVYAQDFFTAAIFAHARRGDGSSDPPEKIIQDNLNFYFRAATVAKENNADILGFPEYGLFKPSERKNMTPYMEDVPDPKDKKENPCQDASSNSSKPILTALSCMARNNKINIIANMGDVKSCSKGSQCPDGKLYYNANVVFDRNGTLVYRYYEEHLWFEPGMNEPTEKQDYTFKTDVGTFGNCIGFDMVFSRLGSNAIPNSVDAVFYPTIGLTSPPFQLATPSWASWAIANNVTLLAVNLQVPGEQSVGSGIYVRTEGAVANTMGEDGISKLIISKVPKRDKPAVPPDAVIYAINETSVEKWDTDTETIPEQCDIKVLGPAKDVYADFRCTSEDVSNYTLVKLDKPEGSIERCNNGMCCKLEYSAKKIDESFYFGVFSGNNNVHNKYSWSVENCFLARCNDVGGKPCGEFLMRTDTTFSKVRMTANFTTEYVYPIFVSSQVKLVPVKDWTYERNGNQVSIYFENEPGEKIITSALKGRPYDSDPPYMINN